MDLLRAAFAGGDGSARLVLLVTPELAAARGRAIWVQTQVLDSDPELDLKVYVVWNPSPGGVDPWPSPFPSLAPDDRIVEYWDSGQAAAQWFASDAGPATVAYDPHALFGPAARRGAEWPSTLETICITWE